MDDIQMGIPSADNICPFCRSAIIDQGENAGVWDGSLGQGSGHVFFTKCHNCRADLVGWEFSPESEVEAIYVRWEGRC